MSGNCVDTLVSSPSIISGSVSSLLRSIAEAFSTLMSSFGVVDSASRTFFEHKSNGWID